MVQPTPQPPGGREAGHRFVGCGVERGVGRPGDILTTPTGVAPKTASGCCEQGRLGTPVGRESGSAREVSVVRREAAALSDAGSHPRCDFDQLLTDTVAGVACFLDSPSDEGRLREALTYARSWEEAHYGRAAAKEWADGFVIPEEKVRADLARFKAAGRDLEKLARRRLSELSPTRMSKEGVARLSADNPEIALLLKLCEGVEIITPTGFEPNGKMARAPLRRAYLETGGAVDKMLDEIHDQGLALYLPYEDARLVDQIQFTEAGWAEKAEKPKGRPTMDCANTTVSGGWALNSKDVKEACKALYGPIHNPTPEMLVCMILEFFEEEKRKDDTVVWEDLVLTKEDLKGAFTLLDIHPKSVKHLAMPLSGDVVILFLCGLFGWTGTPYAFNVVTRALQWEVDRAVRGRVLIYCDDLLGVTLRKYLGHDKAATRKIIRSLLGPDAVAEEKYSARRRSDWIGYDVDLDASLFTLATRNFRKALYRFCQVHVDEPHPVRHVEALASLADRYGCVFVWMRPFTADISACIWSKPNGGGAPPGANRNRTFYLSPAAKRAVRFWRAVLCMGKVNEAQFARPLSSFRPAKAKLTIEFDGSLKGGGVLLFVGGGDSDSAVGGGRASYESLEFGSDASFQNCAELITEILGVVLIRILGYREVEVVMRGDSVVALAWFREGRVPPTSHGHNAHMVMGALAATGAVRVVGTTHLPAKPVVPGGKSNDPCDQLSRGGSFEDIGYGGQAFLDLDGHPWAREALDLCDPRRDLDNHDDFVSFWSRARRLAERLTPGN